VLVCWQVLQQDKQNVPTLANLAMIELDLDHFETAEINIKQAVALAPDDPYSLFVLGRLKFRQKKFDEAIDAFSRAAKLDPQDAQVQNFLGLALSEKGLRGPAETALRKAIQLEPGYANAHNNLAVIYLTQQPPLVELARWHYQKALAAGHPKNLELEKLLHDVMARLQFPVGAFHQEVLAPGGEPYPEASGGQFVVLGQHDGRAILRNGDNPRAFDHVGNGP
jgi:tetratricopeptide (TPR) repeat protein